MNKQQLIEQVIRHFEKDLEVLKAAALATYEAATNEESKAENEYDTRGLEASYLAGAQAKRVGEVEELLFVLKNLKVKDFAEDEAIAATAFVQAELNNKTLYFFILSKGGGLSVNFEGKNIQIVTLASPLGEALLGLKAGETAIVETGDRTLEYDLISVR
jgi:transcription elongation GreA/GreB family factor